MEKQKPFVNGVNEKKFGKVKNMLNVGLLTFATLFPLSHTAEAQRKDIEPPHPITQTQKDRPPRTNQTPQPTLVVPQKEQAHTQQSTESYHIEESDPFSQEKQWDRYLFIPPDEKEAVNKRLFTLSSETSIYISKPTIQYLQYEVNFEGITYEESIQRIISTMPSQLQNSMDKSKFIVIHRMNKQNTLVIEFETIPIQKQNVNDLEIQKTEKEPKKTSLFDQTTATLWTKNGQIIINPSIVLHPTVSANSTIKTNLSVFDQYAAWDETTQKIVLTNGIHILGTFLENNQVVRLLDPQGTSFIKPTPTIDYYETGIDRPTKMKKILHDSLLATPEIFDYPEEIKRYIETGDENDLHHIKLIPHNNPAFFIEIGGKYGFHNEKLIALLEEGINIIDSIDPKTLDLLNQYGLYGVLTDMPDGHDFFKTNQDWAGAWNSDLKRIYINEADLSLQLSQISENSPDKTGFIKLVRNQLLSILFVEAYHIFTTLQRQSFMLSDIFSLSRKKDIVENLGGFLKGEFEDFYIRSRKNKTLDKENIENYFVNGYDFTTRTYYMQLTGFNYYLQFQK